MGTLSNRHFNGSLRGKITARHKAPLRKVSEVLTVGLHRGAFDDGDGVRLECGHEVWTSREDQKKARCLECHEANRQTRIVDLEELLSTDDFTANHFLVGIAKVADFYRAHPDESIWCFHGGEAFKHSCKKIGIRRLRNLVYEGQNALTVGLGEKFHRSLSDLSWDRLEMKMKVICHDLREDHPKLLRLFAKKDLSFRVDPKIEKKEAN